MKHFVTTLWLVAGIAMVTMLSACDLSEVNDDPNEATEINTGSLLTNTFTDLTDTYWGTFNSGRFGIIYAQYWSQNFYTDESRYRFRPGIPNGIWQESYTALNDLETIKTLNRGSDAYSSAGAPTNQAAVALIMQVWVYQNLTDIFGPIPYGEALGGAENFTPGYTAQETLYPALVDSLDKAIGEIDAGAPGPGGDVMFGGDMEKWERFANSLKARVGMRMADANPGAAQSAVESALSDGVMQSNDDNAIFVFDGAAPHWNPFHVNFADNLDDRDDWYVSSNVANLMNEYDDPRRSGFMQRGSTGLYKGFEYGLEQANAQNITSSEGSTFSLPSDKVIRANSDFLFMLYDEVKFIEAEAALRGWSTTSSASAAFESAIRASVDYWTDGSATTAEKDAFISELPSLPGTLDADARQIIGEQKWLALYMQGFQGWAEWRRLDFDGVVIPPAGGAGVELGNDANIAVRMVYPSDERSLNSANLSDAVSSSFGGSDMQGMKLWWDTAYANER